jgi:IS30 family transposase
MRPNHDRGSEFDRFEDPGRGCHASGTDEKRMEACYCDSYCSWQKPHIENAHTLFRRVLP